MTLTYINIPVAILRLKELNLRQKLLLALAEGFGDKGLKMSNEDLGEILCISDDRIGKLLTELKKKGCIKITNGQSRFRAIYSVEKAGVENNSTPSFSTATPSFSPTYSGEKDGHNIKNIKKLNIITSDAVRLAELLLSEIRLLFLQEYTTFADLAKERTATQCEALVGDAGIEPATR